MINYLTYHYFSLLVSYCILLKFVIFCSWNIRYYNLIFYSYKTKRSSADIYNIEKCYSHENQAHARVTNLCTVGRTDGVFANTSTGSNLSYSVRCFSINVFLCKLDKVGSSHIPGSMTQPIEFQTRNKLTGDWLAGYCLTAFGIIIGTVLEAEMVVALWLLLSALFIH